MGDATNSSNIESGTIHFLLENIGPVIATTGCLTVALFGVLLGIQKESKKRYVRQRIEICVGTVCVCVTIVLVLVLVLVCDFSKN